MKYRAFVQRETVVEGFYEIEAENDQEAVTKAYSLYENADPPNMETTQVLDSVLTHLENLEEQYSLELEFE